MASDFDPYQILEVDPSAPPEAIDAAYERLAREHEGDHRAGEDERLRELRTAYALLRDAEQRRAYDARVAERAAYRMAAGEWRPPPEFAPAEPPRRTPWGPVDMLKAIGIVVLGTIAASVPAAFLAEAIAGSVSAIDDDPTALAVVLAASIPLELLLFGTAVHFAVRKYRLSWPALGLRRPDRGGVLFPFGIVLSSLAVVYVYFAVLNIFGVEPETDVPDAAFKNAAPAVVLAVLSLVFAPAMEEIFFRGFIFGGLRGRWGTAAAALASGLLFGLAHVGNTGSLWVVPPIALVGTLFAYAYVYSGSLVAPIVAHFLFNLVSFAAGLASA